ncbi:Mediator of RNA polymerase II transcription subunit 25-like protein [Drosera capensis]
MNETGDVTWQGKQACITGLQGYRNLLTPEHLMPDLPQTMDIVRLQPMDTLTSRCTGWQVLLFRANQSHEILARMRNENSYAEIQLPSQTLLLCADDKQHMQLFGILIHEELHLVMNHILIHNSGNCCNHIPSDGSCK